MNLFTCICIIGVSSVEENVFVNQGV